MQVEHPMILTLKQTMKDHNYIYFLLEYVEGVELFYVMRELDLMDNQQSRFYISLVFLCIEYLHKKNIIYRDLKPENIMVRKDGYITLIDLGICKFLEQ